LLPNRLAYPELLRYCTEGAEAVEAYLYEDDEESDATNDTASRPHGIVSAIKEIARQRESKTADYSNGLAKRILDRLALQVRSAEMDSALLEVTNVPMV